MKKCYNYCAGHLSRMLNRRLLFSKQTRRQCFKAHHPSFLRSGIGQKKTVDAAKICGGAENVVKTETPAKLLNGLLGFITLGIYTPLEAQCVLLTIITWVAHRYGQLYLHCSLIYFWVPSCFCIVISLSLRWNNPVQRCLPVGGGCIIHAGGGSGTHWLTDCADVQPTRRPAATSSRRASFSALASANSFVYLHRAQQHHADASA